MTETIPDLPHTERFAYQHADQWWGCLQCRESHHYTSFCKNADCRKCFCHQKRVDDPKYGTFIYCECGLTDLWD